MSFFTLGSARGVALETAPAATLETGITLGAAWSVSSITGSALDGGAAALGATGDVEAVVRTLGAGWDERSDLAQAGNAAPSTTTA